MDIRPRRPNFRAVKPVTEVPKIEVEPVAIEEPTVKAEPVTPAAISKPVTAKPFDPKSVPPHKRLKWIFFKPEHVSRKKWLVVDLVILILLLGASLGGYALYKHFSKSSPLGPQPKASKRIVKPKTESSRLTGLQIDPELNKRPVTGIMIENSPDARPQSGLQDAGVVVEAIAEGGITRFLALFQDAQPQYVGPVRSVRPYYLDFALAFNAGVAHVGGSPDALSQVRSLKVRDLDEFANAGAYWRITQRYAPHNVYTSFAKLDSLNKKKGFTGSTYDSWIRKKDQPSKQPTATKVDIAISGYYYNVHYDYNPKTNSYLRSEGGKVHTDEKSKAQLNPKVVIAPVMSYGFASDGKHSTYATTGSGIVYIFQDGVVTKGTWLKNSRNSQISFKDANGKIIGLNAGQAWLTMVGKSSDVTYKP